MLILIDGFWGSGKTVLRSLLHGHNQLKVYPYQECIVSSFDGDYRTDLNNFYNYNNLVRKYCFPIRIS